MTSTSIHAEYRDDKRCVCGHSNYSHDLLSQAATGRCGALIRQAEGFLACPCGSYCCYWCAERPITHGKPFFNNGVVA